MSLTRRAGLAGAAAFATAAAAPSPEPLQRWLAALRGAASGPPGPGLLQSYEVRTGTGAADFDRVHSTCAYVYDNAVAALALLAAGDTEAARRIGAALATAQAHDRFWTDGRLRNAYAVGPMEKPAKLPGWWDAQAGQWLEDGYHVGTATGVIAWAIILWQALGPDFRPAAERAADWVERAVAGPAGYQGGFAGHEPSPEKLAWTSTEHNLDLAVAFARLGRRAPGAAAGAFVARMWNSSEARFLSGLKPDRTNNAHSAVDANVWPRLAGSENRAGLDWVLSRHALPEGAPRAEIDGVDFDTDRDGIWLEGTAIAALALRLSDTEADRALAGRLMATLAANTAPSGLIYATTTPTLTTGLSTGRDPNAADFLYYRRPHLAPTGWAVLASLGANPLGPARPG